MRGAQVKRRISLLILFAALLCPSGCIQFSDEVSFAPCDGAVEVEPACARCVAERCEEVHAACADDELCCEDYTCVAACASGDAACRVDCLGAPVDHAGLIAALDQCRKAECTDACLGSGDISFGWPLDCEACMNSGCWQATSACALNPECEAGVACDAGCSDPSCHEGCRELARGQGEVNDACHDASTERTWDHPYVDYSLCLRAQCDLACGIGTTWGCVGDYRWRGYDSDRTENLSFTYRVVDHLDPKLGVSGATVAHCQRADVDCALPISEVISDADGYACLSLPVLDGNGASGFIRVRHADYMTTDEQIGGPIVTSGGSIIEAMSVAAAAALRASLGVSEAPERGTLSVEVRDCAGALAPGVRFEISTGDDETVSCYVGENGELSATQAATSSFGRGSFFNVPADRDPVRLLARAGEGGAIVGCFDVNVRPGVRTVLPLHPMGDLHFGCSGGAQ